MPLLWLLASIAGLVAVWNRLGRFSPKIPLSIAALSIVLTIPISGPSLLGTHVLAPLDLPRLIPPWLPFEAGVEASHPSQLDIPFQIYPWHVLSRRAFLHGELPLWNPASGGGAPLLGNGQAAPFSIPFLLSLTLSDIDSWNYLLALRIPLALLGAWLLARRLGLGGAGAALSAVSFGLGAFVVLWIGYPMGFAAALLPWILVSADIAIRDPGRKSFLFLFASQAVFILAGHPESTALGEALFVLFSIAVARTVREGGWWTRLRPAMIATLAAILLAAPYLLPTAETIFQSARFQTRNLKMNPFFWRLPIWWSLKTLVSPFKFGSSRWSENWGLVNVLESACFVGSLPLLLALAALRKEARLRHRLFWCALGLFSFSLVTRWPPLWHGFQWVPILGSAHFERFRLFGSLSVALLAGAGFDWYLEKPRTSLLRGAAAAGIVVLCIPVIRDEAIVPGLVPRAWSLLVLAAATALLFLFGNRRLLQVGAPAAVALQLAILFHDFTPVIANDRIAPTPTPAAYIHRRIISDPLLAGSRTGGEDSVAFPQVTAADLEDIRFNDPIVDWRLSWISRHRLQVTDGYWPYIRNMDGPLFNFLAVRWWLAPPNGLPPERSRWRGVFGDDTGVVYENLDALPPFFTPERITPVRSNQEAGKFFVDTVDISKTVALLDPGSTVRESTANPPAGVKIERKGTARWDVDVDAGPQGTIVASSLTFPEGWRVSSDSPAKIERVTVNGAFLGFRIPPGNHRVHVRYLPFSFLAGVVLALIGISIAALFTPGAPSDRTAEHDETSPIAQETGSAS